MLISSIRCYHFATCFPLYCLYLVSTLLSSYRVDLSTRFLHRPPLPRHWSRYSPAQIAKTIN